MHTEGMKEPRLALFALLLAAVSAGAETTALEQARAAAAGDALGATSFDGCVGENCAVEAPVAAAPDQKLSKASLTADPLPEPVAIKKDAAPPAPADCPPCPKPWYEKPLALGAISGVIAGGALLALTGMPMLGLFGLLYGFGAGYLGAKFLFRGS